MLLFILKGVHLLSVVTVILNLFAFLVWRWVSPIDESDARNHFMARQVSLIHRCVTFPLLFSIGLTGSLLAWMIGIPFYSPWILEGMTSWFALVLLWIVFMRPYCSQTNRVLDAGFLWKTAILLSVALASAFRMADAVR